MDVQTTYFIGIAEHFVRLDVYGTVANELVKFLFCDLIVKGDTANTHVVYELRTEGESVRPTWSLHLQECEIYTGYSKYDLAYTLFNEIIRQCIYDNCTGYAIHAAAIWSSNGSILLPGISGSGKSTLTTWLVTQGAGYLTDELVIISGNSFEVSPFTRPLSIKRGSFDVISEFLDVDQMAVISGRNGIMLPYRSLNQNYTAVPPPLSLILFPEYKADREMHLLKITPAEGCLRLLECFVNARNMPDHGIPYVANIARMVPMYQLEYSSFQGLQEYLGHLFPDFFHKSRKENQFKCHCT